ncbi:M20/M25/M40 family metallo-hydrolase, partial [Calditrichota bacterium]
SMASLNPTGSFVYSGKVAGMPFDDLVNKMLEVSTLRYFGKSFSGEQKKPSEKGKKPEQLPTRVRSYLRGHLSTIVDYIDQMVSTNSYVHNIEGINTLGNWISERFQQLGFHRHIIPQTEIGNTLYFTNHTQENNDVLLMTHLDTQHDYHKFIPFKEDRGKLFGSGIAESKGGIAVILAALQALRFTRVLKSVNCGVLLTSDYFLNSKFTKNHSSGIINNSDHIIGMGHGDLQGSLFTSCMGMQQYQIEINNQKNHNDNHIPDIISVLTKKITAWKKLTSNPKDVKMFTNSIQAYQFDGSTPDYAIVTMTIHFKDKNLGNAIDEKIIKIAKNGSNSKIQVRVQKGGGRLPLNESETSRNFFNQIHSIAKKMEITVKPANFYTCNRWIWSSR